MFPQPASCPGRRGTHQSRQTVPVPPPRRGTLSISTQFAASPPVLDKGLDVFRRVIQKQAYLVREAAGPGKTPAQCGQHAVKALARIIPKPAQIAAACGAERLFSGWPGGGTSRRRRCLHSQRAKMPARKQHTALLFLCQLRQIRKILYGSDHKAGCLCPQQSGRTVARKINIQPALQTGHSLLFKSWF